MAKKKGRALAAGSIDEILSMIREHPQLQRLVEDQEMRERLLGAYGAARSAYARMNNGKAPARALLQDRRLQGELAAAAAALRDVSLGLMGEPHKPEQQRRKRRRGRSLLLLAAGTTVAALANKSLRGKALDLVFGAEEEFSYTSTTAPAQPAPKSTAAL